MRRLPGKRIWTGDIVRVVSGEHEGLVGKVTKREPKRFKPARYVWIRELDSTSSSYGTRVSVDHVHIIQHTNRDTHDRYRKRPWGEKDRARVSTRSMHEKAYRQKYEDAEWDGYFDYSLIGEENSS